MSGQIVWTMQGCTVRQIRAIALIRRTGMWPNASSGQLDDASSIHAKL